MVQLNPFPSLFICVSMLGLMVLGTASAAQAEDLKTWDQEKVTAIAQDISTRSRALRDTLRRKPPRTAGAGSQRSFWSFREEIQVLVSASARMHSALAGGAGMDETFPTYMRLLNTARRAERQMRRVGGLSAGVNEKVDGIADAIRQIRPFYEDEPSL